MTRRRHGGTFAPGHEPAARIGWTVRERVVAGQRLMQAATDIFLGWQRIKGLDGVTRDYYVRQFHDWKGSAEGDRIVIASYLGKGETFDRAMADFSVAYADQNERDYAAFAAAVDSGRLAARTGV